MPHDDTVTFDALFLRGIMGASRDDAGTSNRLYTVSGRVQRGTDSEFGARSDENAEDKEARVSAGRDKSVIGGDKSEL